MDLKITPSGQTIVKPTALGPGANTDTKLLIYGLFQKGRVLAQDAVKPLGVTPAEPGVYLNELPAQRGRGGLHHVTGCHASPDGGGHPAATECRTFTGANTSSQDLNSHGCLPVNSRSPFFADHTHRPIVSVTFSI